MPIKTASSLYDSIIKKIDDMAKTAEVVIPEKDSTEKVLPPVDELVKALEEEAARSEQEDVGEEVTGKEPIKEAKEEIEDAGNPIPDGSGPHGRGNGPGKGKADGSGMGIKTIEEEEAKKEDNPESEGCTAKEAADKMYDASLAYIGKSIVAMRKEAGIPLLGMLKNLSLKDAARVSNVVAGGLGGAAGMYYGGKREEGKDEVEDDMIYNVGIRNGAVAMANAITERLNAQVGDMNAPVEGVPNV